MNLIVGSNELVPGLKEERLPNSYLNVPIPLTAMKTIQLKDISINLPPSYLS